MDQDGNVVGKIKIANNSKVELEIETDPSYYVTKPNGWSSK